MDHSRNAMNQPMTAPMRLCRFGLPFVCLLTAPAAFARPVELSAGAGVTYDDNIFRLPGGSEPAVDGESGRSDFILRAEARMRLTAQLSLQEFFIDASASRSQFMKFDELSFTGLQGVGQWNWRVGSRLSGDLGLTYERRLTDFSYFREQERNLEDVLSPYFHIRYVPGNQGFIYGGYSRIRFSNSSESLKPTDHDTDIVEAGLGYRFLNDAEVRVGVRRTENDYDSDQGIPVDGELVRNDFRQDEIEGTVEWPLGARTKVSGRLAYTERDVRDVPERNFSGLTGYVTVEYVLSELTRFYLSGRRELAGVDDILANAVKTDSITGWVEYKPKAYLTLRVEGEILWHDFREFDVLVPVVGPDRKEQIKSASLAADYRWSEDDRVELSVSREERRTNEPLFDYNANLVALSLILTR